MDKAENNDASEQKKEAPEHLHCNLVQEVFSRDFDVINTNHNKYVSERELRASLLNHTIPDKDARVAEAVIANFHKFELLSNDEWGVENNGISRKDLAKFEANRKTDPSNDLALAVDTMMNSDVHNKEKFLNILDIYKGNMDDDKSGTLSKSELEHYIRTSKDGPDAVAVAKLVSEHFDEINQFGSKNSYGAYGSIFRADKNERVITAQEFTNMRDLLKPEAEFRQKLWAAHDSREYSSRELGKQGRTIMGKGDSAGAIVFGALVEVAASVAGDTGNQMDKILTDYQDRKEMLQSWKFFDK